MTQKQLGILALVTALAVLAAILLRDDAPSSPEAELRGRALFPDLSERINALAAIRIEDGANTVTLERGEAGWTIAEKAGYPADSGKVRDLLTGLLDAAIRQIKTDNPALYDRIGLGEGATRLTLRDGEGGTIAALDGGKRQYGGGEFLSFVRPGEQPRSYLVDSLPELRAEPTGWLPETILSLDRPRLATVRITHDDGEAIAVSRPDPDARFELEGKREEERYIGYQPAGSLATAYSTLRIDDVRPAGEIDLGSARTTAAIETFDGLTVALRLFDTGDETGDAWIALEASYSLPDEEEGPEKMPDAPADGAAEAERLNARTEGWVFRIPASKVGALTRTRAELVEPEPVEEEESEAAESPGGT